MSRRIGDTFQMRADVSQHNLLSLLMVLDILWSSDFNQPSELTGLLLVERQAALNRAMNLV